MKEIHLGPVSKRDCGDVVTVDCQIEVNGEAGKLTYRVTHGSVSDAHDPYLAATILPAMKMNAAVETEGWASRQLMGGLESIQSVYNIWRKDDFHGDGGLFTRVPVAVGSSRSMAPTSKPKGVGAFFSGGIDSFFTLLEHREEITHLIFVHHFEATFDPGEAEQTAKNVRAIAAEFGKELIEVETNARELFGPFVSWHYYHGGMLASIALLLAPRFRRVYIPSSYSILQLGPWGSHPLVDPLFSTELCEIRHDRCDVTRLEKTQTVADSDFALRHLRVCWAPTVNCGRCNKCLRTLLALQVLGRIDQASSFPRGKLSASEVSRIDLRERRTVKYFQEIQDYLIDRGHDPELVDAIESAKDLEYFRGPLHAWRLVVGKSRSVLSRVKRAASRWRRSSDSLA